MISYYEDLIVWQKSMDLVEEVYKLVKLLPSDEIFGLASQMRRAAVSIPSNIAEGQSRHTKKNSSIFYLLQTVQNPNLKPNCRSA